MKSEQEKLRLLLKAVREAYERGENAMRLARELLEHDDNDVVSTLLAYDLQAGSYNERARRDPEGWAQWCRQTAEQIRPYVEVEREHSLLEVGCGEATTLAGVLRQLDDISLRAYGFDVSWSRVHEGYRWLREQGREATLFVADLFCIPLADASVDVVYTTHSLEPNGGREVEALRECLRVARHAVVCVEPLYELGTADQQRRMREHGYVRGLREAATELACKVARFELLPIAPNPMNPTGVMVLEKDGQKSTDKSETMWQCPLTASPMSVETDVFSVPAMGLVYPVLRGVPLLRGEHAVVASRMMGA